MTLGQISSPTWLTRVVRCFPSGIPRNGSVECHKLFPVLQSGNVEGGDHEVQEDMNEMENKVVKSSLLNRKDELDERKCHVSVGEDRIESDEAQLESAR